MNYLIADERCFADRPGGSARVAWELAALARERGHRVAMLCGTDGDPRPGRAEVDGVAVVRYAFPRLVAWDPRRLWAHVAAAAHAAADHLGHVRWDAVHAHTLAPGLGAYRALGGGARRLATVHSPCVAEQRINWSGGGAVRRLKRTFGTPVLRRAERALLDQAHQIAALSCFTIEELAREQGDALAARIACIPWWHAPAVGVDRDAARATLGWPTDRPVLFTLRRLVPRMGVDTLVEAAGALEDRYAFRVVVGGEGPERERLESLARRSARPDRIAFAGRMSEADVLRAYAAADLFVLPTHALECFGLIALEAMSQGCPVVGARVGAIPEMLAPLAPELLFPPADASALRELLRRFLDGTLRIPARAAVQAYAAARYARDRLVERHVAFLEGRAPDDRSELPDPSDFDAWAAWLAAPADARDFARPGRSLVAGEATSIGASSRGQAGGRRAEVTPP